MNKWLNSPQYLRFDVKDRICHITLNRPEKRNAQNMAAQEELHSALMEADDLEEVSVVVLQGAGKDFCAGADIDEFTSAVQQPAYDVARYRGRSSSFENDAWRVRQRSQGRLRLFEMHKPVIAKVQGNCLAVGSDMALLCDFVIVANDARIGFPATRALGSPANQMWLYHVGPQWAKRFLMTGDAISGRDAAKIGLALKAVPKEKLDNEVEAFAKRLALMEPDLLATHKRIVNVGLELMGWHTLQRLGSEADARAHLSKAFKRFGDEARSSGLKAALRQRDEPYGGNDIEPIE